jgi:hypothetical protein
MLRLTDIFSFHRSDSIISIDFTLLQKTVDIAQEFQTYQLDTDHSDRHPISIEQGAVMVVEFTTTCAISVYYH